MEADNRAHTQWYVLRDLKRPNAKQFSYQLLQDKGFEVFTPLTWKTVDIKGRRQRRQVPCIPDLLFVRSTREQLDPEIQKTTTLQYRYIKGAAQYTPMTVPDRDMSRFMIAVSFTADIRYYTPDEITPQMYGRRIRIIGGQLDSFEGHLLSIKGQRHRRLIIELPGLITAAIEVNPDLIQLL